MAQTCAQDVAISLRFFRENRVKNGRFPKNALLLVYRSPFDVGRPRLVRRREAGGLFRSLFVVGVDYLARGGVGVPLVASLNHPKFPAPCRSSVAARRS